MDGNNPAITATLPQMKAAADSNGLRLVVLDARTEVDIDATFASLRSKGVDAVLVTTNPFYEGRRDDIVALAKRHSVPVLYPWREYSVAGGLISYGTSFTESYRQAGLYVGRILKGEKPADLPVVQATKFELLVNTKTAKLLGLTVPPSILVAADEVIE
jgi:putative ABC transport system substrate-binding protein